MKAKLRFEIRSDGDLMIARSEGRRLASNLGFTPAELTCLVTAISELARNILQYAGTGEVVLSDINEGSRRGIEVIARDEGPGIPDVRLAMQDGYSTSEGLGLGLPGARRLVDEFEINSEPGQGTTVIIKKWAT